MYINPQFGQDLFKGTSTYYSKYRFSYNKTMIEEIIKIVKIDKNDKLLDLACGPGRLTIPLSKYFKNAYAIDWEKEMIEEGGRLAKEMGIENIEWMNGKAEDCIFEPDTIKLITIGDAFHRMDQLTILQNSYKMIKKGGYLALLYSNTVTAEDYEWQKELKKILPLYENKELKKLISMYYENTDNKSKNEKSLQPWDMFLKETGFINVTSKIYEEIIYLSIEEIIGYLYSMSVYTKNIIGDKLENFENEIKEKLLKIEPENRFEFNYKCGYYIGEKG